MFPETVVAFPKVQMFPETVVAFPKAQVFPETVVEVEIGRASCRERV